MEQQGNIIGKFIDSLPEQGCFAIIRADYNSVEDKTDKNDITPLKKYRSKQIDELNKKVKSIANTTKDNYFADDCMLVLWSNLPKSNYMYDIGHTTEFLLTRFCQRVAKLQGRAKLYIDSPQTLCDSVCPSITQVLKNLLLIWRTSRTVPVFLEGDDFLTVAKDENVTEEEVEAYAQKQGKTSKISLDDPLFKAWGNFGDLFTRAQNRVGDIWRKNYIDEKNREYFERFFSSVELLAKLEEGENKKSPKKEQENGFFIDAYFEWQSGKKKVEDCVTLLYNQSRATWYRYVAAFENNPIYPEYVNAYVEDIQYTKKLGKSLDAYDFLSYYKSVSTSEECRNQRLKINREVYENIKEIHSVVDVYRSVLSCKYKIKVTLKKVNGKANLKKNLEAHGLTIEDITLDI